MILLLLALLTATPATLPAQLAAAQPGDTVALSGDAFPAVAISRKVYDPPLTLTSADPTHRARLASLSFTQGSGLIARGLDVAMVPTLATVSSTPAVRIADASNVALSDLHVTGGLATWGVAADSDPTLPRPGDSVLGWPIGRGVTIERSHGVSLTGSEISGVHKGVVLTGSWGVTVAGNDIHHVRTSPIVGEAGHDLTIAGNHVHDASPWQWGWAGGAGDHADLIHLWTTLTQAGPSDAIAMTGNLAEQGAGVAVLGIYFDDNRNLKGFTNVRIAGNVILNGNNQGMRLENVHGVVSGNVMLQAAGGAKDNPSIILATGADPALTGNIAGDSAGLFATRPGNLAVPAGVQPPLALELARRALARP